MEVVEALGEAVERTAFRGAEISGVYVVDDGVLPPGVGVHAGAGPARTSQCLCQCEGRKGAGEKEEENSTGSLGHTLVLTMLRENLAWRNRWMFGGELGMR